MTDVFISYSRQDKAFVQVLNQALIESKYEAWVDWENIPLTADWWAEIEAGIEAADTFIFVISSDSIESKVCGQEIDHAVAHHKRLVPIVRRDGFDMALVRPALGKHNWLFFREDDDFDTAFQSLVKALNTDLDHVKEHTRVLLKAVEWEKKNHRDDLLLRGRELEDVIHWLTQNAEKEPRSTQLQRDYINASRLAAIAQQKEKLEHEALVRKRITRALIAAVGGLVVALGLGFTTFQQYRRAEAQRQDAVRKEIDALVSSANALLESDQPLDALIESLKAANQLEQLEIDSSDLNYPIAVTLHQAITTTQETNRLLDHSHWVEGVSFSPQGDTFVTVGRDGSVRIWQENGQLLTQVDGKKGEQAWAASFSPDGKILAVAVQNSVKLLDQSGNTIGWLPGHSDSVTQVTFSPNGQTIATTSWDGTIGLWNLDGTLLQFIDGHTPIMHDVQFSPDGKIIASAGGTDYMIRLWDLNGTLLGTLGGHTATVSSVAFSPDGEMLASASFDGTVKLWSHDGELQNTFEIEANNLVTGVEFSRDGQTLAIVTGEKNTAHSKVKLLSLDDQTIQQLEGHHGSRITDVSTSPSHDIIASTSFDGTIRLWSLNQQEPFTRMDGHESSVNSVSFSADGHTLASGGQDGTVILWDTEGQLLKVLKEHTDAVNQIAFNPTNNTLISASDDQTLSMWQSDGALQNTLDHAAEVESLSISPKGDVWVSVSKDGILNLWTSEGELVQQLPIEDGLADIVRVHPTEPIVAVAVGQGKDRNIVLWNWQEDILTPLKTVGEFAVRDIDFSPDGSSLAVASWHGNITFWNLAGEKLNSFFAGYAGPVSALQHSPNGNAIAVASRPSAFLFTLDGELIQGLQSPEQQDITSLSFTPDGQHIAVGYDDGKIILWNLNLSDLVRQGCQKLENYLLSHPETLIELTLCQTSTRLAEAANTLVSQGEMIARQGNKTDAIRLLKQALAWNPELEIVPEDRVEELADQGEAVRRMNIGDELAREGNFESALEEYQAAKTLDPNLTFNASERAEHQRLQAEVSELIEAGRSFASEGKIELAIAQFVKAKELEPNLAVNPLFLANKLAAPALLEQAATLVDNNQLEEAMENIRQVQQITSTILPEPSGYYADPNILNTLCREGSLQGYASTVLPICEQAVAFAPTVGAFIDSRGLARALTGDFDGAISDFQYFIGWIQDDGNISDFQASARWTDNEEVLSQRQQWIEALKAGENPFTPEVLESLQ